jgi:hypothetical protein
MAEYPYLGRPRVKNIFGTHWLKYIYFLTSTVPGGPNIASKFVFGKKISRKFLEVQKFR